MDAKIVRCDLCDSVFYAEGNLQFLNQLERHEQWHASARMQGRNTTQGTVKWIRLG